jgi:hypothetical protein
MLSESSMKKPPDPRAKELLDVARDVVAGVRDESELDAHGISLGQPITGEPAKAMLLDELDNAAEAERAAATLWAEMTKEGAQEGSTARLEARFSATDERVAAALAANVAAERESDGWVVAIAESQDSSGRRRVMVLTRPLVLGPEVLQVLLEQMTATASEFACDFDGLSLPPAKKRSWWRFW